MVKIKREIVEDAVFVFNMDAKVTLAIKDDTDLDVDLDVVRVLEDELEEDTVLGNEFWLYIPFATHSLVRFAISELPKRGL